MAAWRGGRPATAVVAARMLIRREMIRTPAVVVAVTVVLAGLAATRGIPILVPEAKAERYSPQL